MGRGTMTAFRALLTSELTIFLRDRMALFFTLLFPLIYILIFGFLMGDLGDVDQSRLGIVIASEDDEQSLMRSIEETGSMNLSTFSSAEELEHAIAARTIDFGLFWDGSALRFFYDANRVQENFAFEQAARGIATEFDFRRQAVTRALPIEEVQVGMIQSIGWYNLVLPGILAFSILSAGLFAVSGHLTQMKERNILDRLVVTPMPPLALLSAIVVIRLGVVFVSTLITLGVGIIVFGLQFEVNWFRYVIFVICATLGTMGMGTIIALLVRRPSDASSLANVLALVMMFFAGIYFPIEFMPAFLRSVSKGLPLTHMANAMRYVTGVIEMSELEFWVITFSLLGFAIVLFPVLARYVVRPLRR
ncbi:ABC transporter permease [Candidatus Bipolaricaulota bacterium]